MTSPLPPHQRYQFKPGIGSSHRWALEVLSRMKPNVRVLDIGSGSGIIGSELKARGFDALFAVEVDPAARSHVSSIYRQVEASIDPFLQDRFDVILLLDVLEHIPSPQAFFSQVLQLLAPGGQILVSVPNIAHWSVRFALLFGWFEYTERGILDKTHVHFFTRRHLRKFLSSQNLEISHFDASIAPFEFILPRPLWDNAIYQALARLRLALARLSPGLFAYQHLALLTRKS